MIWTPVLVALVCARGVHGPAPATPGGARTTLAPTPEYLAGAVNEFSYNLLVSMLRDDDNQNVILGPTSITGLLAMTMLGAVGETYDELARALGFSQDITENRDYHLSLGALLRAAAGPGGGARAAAVRGGGARAAAVPPRAALRPLYRQAARRVYDAEVLEADFTRPEAAKEIINDWVSEATSGLLRQFLPRPLPPDTRLALLAAQHLAAEWDRPFDPKHTVKMTFHRPRGAVTADMMLAAGPLDYAYSEEYGCQLLGLNYTDQSRQLLVLQPARGEPLPALLRRLRWPALQRLAGSMTTQPLVVRFPKLDIGASVDLRPHLQTLGINTMFAPGKANFGLMLRADDAEGWDCEGRRCEGPEGAGEGAGGGGLRARLAAVPNPGVHVDAVQHQARLTIDERGTRGAAAAGGVLARTARVLRADSPVLLLLRARGVLVFAAALMDPTQGPD